MFLGLRGLTGRLISPPSLRASVSVLTACSTSGALRLVPPRSDSQGFGPVAGWLWLLDISVSPCQFPRVHRASFLFGNGPKQILGPGLSSVLGRSFSGTSLIVMAPPAGQVGEGIGRLDDVGDGRVHAAPRRRRFRDSSLWIAARACSHFSCKVFSSASTSASVESRCSSRNAAQSILNCSEILQRL